MRWRPAAGRQGLANWVKDPSDPAIRHFGGVSFREAPLPRRWHRCFTQTFCMFGTFGRIERCPCGGYRNEFLSSRWQDRNSRRHGPI